jgi:hypothetical protein
MKRALYGSALLALMVSGAINAQTNNGWNDGDLIVTSSNTASNELLVYNAQGTLIEQSKTGPANGNAPFGLATCGNDAYLTIAHANEISLMVREWPLLDEARRDRSCSRPTHPVTRYPVMRFMVRRPYRMRGW